MPRPRLVNFDMRRPFTYADAVAAGVSPSSLRGTNFRRIFRGVYIHSMVPDHPLIRVRGALLIHPPDAYASHVSAARVYGVPAPTLPDEHVSVFEEKDRRRRPGIRNHVARADTPVTTVRGIRVSTPEQMFVELAGILNLVDLVVVGDDLVRLKKGTPNRLRAFSEASGHVDASRRDGRPPGCAKGWTRRWRPGCGCSSSSPDCRSRRSTTRSCTRMVGCGTGSI